MSKFFQSKKFLTLQEAATHLSMKLEAEVLISDIYRAALQRQITISADFINKGRGCLGKIVDESGAKRTIRINPPATELGHFPSMPEGAEINMITSLPIGDGRFINFDEKVVAIEGVWDLMMIGSERFDVDHAYQMMTSGPPIELVNFSGCFVQRGDDVCRLMTAVDWGDELNLFTDRQPKQKPLEYVYAGELPGNCVWGIRTEALTEYLAMLSKTSKTGHPAELGEKSLSSKERYSLLILLAAVCKMAKLDYDQRGVAGAVVKAAEEMGVSITDDTVRKYFKEIREAVAIRSK